MAYLLSWINFSTNARWQVDRWHQQICVWKRMLWNVLLSVIVARLFALFANWRKSSWRAPGSTSTKRKGRYIFRALLPRAWVALRTLNTSCFSPILKILKILKIRRQHSAESACSGSLPSRRIEGRGGGGENPTQAIGGYFILSRVFNVLF